MQTRLSMCEDRIIDLQRERSEKANSDPIPTLIGPLPNVSETPFTPKMALLLVRRIHVIKGLITLKKAGEHLVHFFVTARIIWVQTHIWRSGPF